MLCYVIFNMFGTARRIFFYIDILKIFYVARIQLDYKHVQWKIQAPLNQMFEKWNFHLYIYKLLRYSTRIKM